MNTYFSSDLHFHHKNIIKYSNRPFNSVEHMNDSIIDNINSLVRPEDTHYHLGDFSFAKLGPTIEVLKQLKSAPFCILGNHDQVLWDNREQLIAEGWVKDIVHYKELRINNKTIVLFHFGQRVWNKSHHGAIHLFGHSHGTLPPHGLSCDVGADSPHITGKPEYRPFSVYEVIDYMAKRKISVEDLHGSKE